MTTIAQSPRETERTASKQATDDVRSALGTPTWEVARFYPAQGEWTEEEYFSLETNHLIEFDDGVLEFLPMPDLVHQLLSGFLYESLKAFIAARQQGTVLYAPYRVRIRPGKYREPDVLYVPVNGRLHRRYTDDAGIVVEIVSEGKENRERDLLDKRADYAAAGIPEYWIVDPETTTITVLNLPEGSGEYAVHGEFQPGQTAASVLLDGFTVDVAACFAAADAAQSADEK